MGVFGAGGSQKLFAGYENEGLWLRWKRKFGFRERKWGSVALVEIKSLFSGDENEGLWLW